MSIPRPRPRTLLITAAVTASASLSLIPLASAHTTPAAAKPTVVLVHGAFADASSWNGVVERLQRDGYPVIAPANPLRGLAEDSTYVASILASVKGPVILVGHSYGGAVISQAAAGDPQVKALVYIAALVPDKGEKLSTLSDKFPGTNELAPALRPVPFSNSDGTNGSDLYVDPTRFRAVFAADLPASQTVVMGAEQRPVAAAAFASSATAAAWRTIPSWALVARQDEALGAPLERFEARRAHSHTVEINSSHVALISHPGTVTHLIEDAATSTAP
ncbi:esterase/lipase family protein [Streptomyces sp. NPDC048504]|uniref:esterase/lipase family protein n=1 Tax=Streptomyces sp. NPDC048504 TaxID=3365559 RepID=UPI003723CDC1